MDYFNLAAVKASMLTGAIGVVAPQLPAALPFFEVSYATVGMSVAGSLLAFAYSPPVVSRKRMYGYAVGGIFIGIWGLKLLQWWGLS